MMVGVCACKDTQIVRKNFEVSLKFACAVNMSNFCARFATKENIA